MRPKENIEKFVRVRKPHVTTSRQMDKRTLDDSFAAMEQTIRTKSAEHKPSVQRISILSRMIKLTAAAAVIIVTTGLIAVFVDRGIGEKPDTNTVSEIVKSPVEMMTAMSLERAFQRGGIEAVEEQSRKAFRPLGLKPKNLSFDQILAEFNGNCHSTGRTRL
ncbi:MAG TPA: hypothetical protein HPP66_10270 [Planctomycetes bacterium]|nr:hypothetical protein [Planctomycetota bacterium]